MRRPFLFLFLLALVPGYLINERGNQRDIFGSICQLADEHFYERDQVLIQWVDRCFQAANRIGFFESQDRLVAAIQDQMDEMHASHFQIYNPEEDSQLWKGEVLDSGLRARYVEDRLLIYKVMPATDAFDQGLKPGDEILAIEGTDNPTPWGAQHRSGRYTFRRDGGVFDLVLRTRKVIEDQKVKIVELGKGTALVDIPSFRSDFFEKKKWIQQVSRFAKYQRLILDLRENSGGNFVAMLRALSPFFCGARTIGEIVQPRKLGDEYGVFADDLADNRQLAQLDHSRGLNLVTFTDYGCYRGQVTALIASDTASTAEIFSEALKHRPSTRIFGQPTAGDVLLGVWYELPKLGPGYSISVPEAVYVTAKGLVLENNGVEPDRTLYYDLKTSLEGRDAWIEAAKK